MLIVSARLRTVALFGALTLGSSACGSGNENGSGPGGPTESTGNGNGDASPTMGSNEAGANSGSDDDAATTASNGSGSTPMPSGGEGGLNEDGGVGVTTDGGAVAVPEGGNGSPPPDAGSGVPSAGGACAGGKVGTASTSGMASRSDGNVEFTGSTKTHITSLTTTLTVPAKPTSQNGTLFLWPGLEPLTQSINNLGVLQPVLTWGGTCAPGAPNNYDSWWISGQYVTYTTSCAGGPGMDVAVGDQLNLAITLSGTTWTQTITDVQTGKTVTFDQDLKGQAQDWAIFEIESDGVPPVADVIFTSTTLTFADADPSACQPSSFGTNDYYSAPVTSTDGTSCCISKIILRANGVPPTSPNSP